LTSGSSTGQAVPSGFHVVQPRGPVAHAFVRTFPTRYATLDLTTGHTRPVEQTTEVWWDRKSGLWRGLFKLGRYVQYESVQQACVRESCMPPGPWGWRKTLACCLVASGSGTFAGHRVRWVKTPMPKARNVFRFALAFDVRTNAPVAYQVLEGGEVASTSQVSSLETLRPDELTFAVPDRGAGQLTPSEHRRVRGHGLGPATRALAVAPLWLGRSYEGAGLATVDSGIDSVVTEKGTLLCRVPFVRFNYETFTLAEYGSKHPYGCFQSGPPVTLGFQGAPRDLSLVRGGVSVVIQSASPLFRLRGASALKLARSLRPLPAG
jgi:hypothetical protein